MSVSAAALHPRPQRIVRGDRGCVLPAEPVVSVLAPDALAEPALAHLESSFASHGLTPRRAETGGLIRLVIDPRATPHAQGYRLQVGVFGIELVAVDAAGLYYGARTLSQWLETATRRGGKLRLAGVQIVDWPDFAHRGVMLDVSRDRVPTVGTLEELIDLLAGFKVNQLQLYFEHTFAYRGHEIVWRGASPFTGEEIERLDAYCQAHFIELVPNQNSFGHFHRWLRHERYRPLAECPEGVRHPFDRELRPFSLCATDPGVFELLDDLYGQLLPHFSSRSINVGCDETFDLGKGRSAEACAARGREEVYLDYLERVHELAAKHGRRIQFWGDIIVERPDLIGRLPRDAVALEWGYEANHPFAENARRFAASGLEFYVCPGTSGWNSFSGRSANAVANLAAAAEHGHAQGASGYLVTDWGDFGHLQPLPSSYPGLLAGAGCAWNAGSRTGLAEALPGLLDRHVFRDAAGVTGRAVVDLGDVHRLTGADPINGSALFFLVVLAHEPVTGKRFEGVTVEGLETARKAVAEALRPLRRARLDRPDAELVVAELRWSAAMLDFAARLGKARLEAGAERPLAELPRAVRRRLATRLAPLVTEYRRLWPARSRPGGLEDSVVRLEAVLEMLAGET
ncbi:MAG: family 20 glycosylhydrolase [Acidobacteria bacterium]|nr:family 20 glycosylhydrolase [Acidobacteriota bacterium]